MSLVLIPTLHAEHLARRMSLPQDSEILYIQGNKDGSRFFPDGEIYVRLHTIKPDTRVVILHAGAPDPNGGIIELEMVLSVLADNNIKGVEIFFSYFPYGMQDNPKEAGETNAAENLIHKLTACYGVRRIFVLDAHFIGQAWLKKYPVKNVSVFPLLREAALRDYPSAVFLTPDQGGKRRMALPGTTKKRINSFEVAISRDDSFVSTVKNQIVGVVDDLVETGGTAVKFSELCREVGAKDVFAIVTHGLLESGIRKLKTAYSQVYLTNSIEHADSGIDISQVIMDEIIHQPSSSNKQNK